MPLLVALALEACRPMALAVVLRVGVPARDAPDVVQNLLIALLRTCVERAHWPSTRSADYVAAAARVAARRYLWLAARRPETLEWGDVLADLQEQASLHAPAPPSAEAQILALEAELALLGETSIDHLSTATDPAFWRVFHAYAVQGIPIADIARDEGAPVPTIYNRLRLARRDLQAAILRRRAATRR